MQDNTLKNPLNNENEVEKSQAKIDSLEYKGDIRALIIGHIFFEEIEEIKIKKSLHGRFKDFY